MAGRSAERKLVRYVWEWLGCVEWVGGSEGECECRILGDVVS
jgi:hypothetical protein